MHKDLFYLIFRHKRFDQIDIISLFDAIWQRRKVILLWEIVGITIALILCFSIPKEYTTTVKLAGEQRITNNLSNTLNGSLAGILMGNLDSQDAYNQDLYSSIIYTIPFCHDLLDIVIDTINHHTVRDLIKSEKRPWWSLHHLFASTDESNPYPHNAPFSLSKSELELTERLCSRITLAKVERTGMLQLQVTLQDQYASAIVADSVTSRLQEFMSAYRQQKISAQDALNKSQEEQSYKKYNRNLERYYNFLDSNANLTWNRDRIKGDNLRNEYELSKIEYFTNYNKSRMSNLKLERDMPIYYVIAPATVSVKASSPRKLVIISYTVFLFTLIPILRIIFRPST